MAAEFYICDTDRLPLFSIRQRNGQEHNSQIQSMLDTKGILYMEK